MPFSLAEIIEVDCVVARQEELLEIHAYFDKQSSRRTVVIQGLGGMGKTQLAAAYAKRHRDDYSAVFWVNARDEASLKKGLVKIARRVDQEHPYVTLTVFDKRSQAKTRFKSLELSSGGSISLRTGAG
jgi:MoxR-like ATPase